MLKTQRHHYNSSILSHTSNPDQIISLYSARKYSSKLLSDLNMTYSRLTDNQFKFDQIKEDKSKVLLQQTVQHNVCKNCRKWKNFASQTKRILLELQSKIIQKQQSLEFKFKEFQQEQITQIQNLKSFYQTKIKNLQEETSQLITKQKSFRNKLQKQSQMKTTQRTISELQQTLKKSHYDKEKLKQIKLQDSQFYLKKTQKNNQSQNVYLSKLFQNSYKEKEKHLDYHKSILQEKKKQSNNFDKLNFQNQSLKSYNQTLIKQLKKGRVLK